MIGKASFDDAKLVENYGAALDEILRAKPSSAKAATSRRSPFRPPPARASRWTRTAPATFSRMPTRKSRFTQFGRYGNLPYRPNCFCRVQSSSAVPDSDFFRHASITESVRAGAQGMKIATTSAQTTTAPAATSDAVCEPAGPSSSW